jgi:hypothetical protein
MSILQNERNDKMRKIKIIALIIGVAIMVTTMAVPIAAADNTQKIDYTKHSSVAELDLNSYSTFGLLTDYNVYADKWFIMSNGIGVGCEGWTNLTSKSDGSYIYHYSNARAWLGDLYWDSGRQWGSGQVYASTGNVGQGAISTISIYYGT